MPLYDEYGSMVLICHMKLLKAPIGSDDHHVTINGSNSTFLCGSWQVIRCCLSLLGVRKYAI